MGATISEYVWTSHTLNRAHARQCCSGVLLAAQTCRSLNLIPQQRLTRLKQTRHLSLRKACERPGVGGLGFRDNHPEPNTFN